MKTILAGITAMSFALAADAAKPPKRDFGPDTTSTNVNTGSAIVPGLTCDESSQPIACSGYLATAVDGTRVDVTVWLPNTTTPHPLVVGIHGWGGSKRSMNQYAQRMTDAGIALLSYSARGFGDSYGQANLADVNVEGADLRSIIGQIADDAQLSINAGAVGVFGASYGGAHSYLAAIRPAFTSPGGRNRDDSSDRAARRLERADRGATSQRRERSDPAGRRIQVQLHRSSYKITAFAVEGRTAWITGVSLDRRSFLAYAQDGGVGRRDVFRLGSMASTNRAPVHSTAET